MDPPLVFLGKLTAELTKASATIDQMGPKLQQVSADAQSAQAVVVTATAAIDVEASRGVTIFRGAQQEIETTARGINSTAESVSATTSATAASVRSASAEARTASAEAQQAASAVSAAGAEVKTVRDRIFEARPELAAFVNDLDEFAPDSPAAALALSGLESLFSAMTDTQSVASSLGGGLTNLNGQVTTFMNAVNQVGPSAGEVQSVIRDFLADVKGRTDEIDQIVSTLDANATTVTRGLAELVREILAGESTLQDLRRLLDQLREGGLDGSLAAVVGDRLEELLPDALDAGAFG